MAPMLPTIFTPSRTMTSPVVRARSAKRHGFGTRAMPKVLGRLSVLNN